MEKKFHKRGFVSQLTAFSFLAMTITGIVLYIVPQGRIAYWVDWKFIGLTKTDWTNLHILSCFLFVIVGSFHIYYNWRALMNYLFRKAAIAASFKRELALSVLIFCFVLISGMFQIPPLKYIIDLNEYIKNLWVKNKEYEPPFGHAEQLSLRVFAKKMKIDLNLAMQELKNQGIVVEKDTDSLQTIARRNKTSPMNIYKIIKKFEEKEIQTGIVYTPELVDEKFAGIGVGRKTLAQICEENNIDLTLAMKRLSEKGIRAKESETFREIADRHNTVPIEILKMILIEDYKPSSGRAPFTQVK